MGSIAEKLQYMSNAVNDIQLAINEMGVTADDKVELGYYGDKIREIANTNGNNIKDFYKIEKYEGFSKLDLLPKDIKEVSDLVIVGNIANADTFDCITFDAFEPYNLNHIVTETVEDVSGTYKF